MIRLGDVHVIPDYTDDTEELCYVARVPQGGLLPIDLGRIISPDHGQTWNARDSVGMNRKEGFATPSAAAQHLVDVHNGSL